MKEWLLTRYKLIQTWYPFTKLHLAHKKNTNQYKHPTRTPRSFRGLMQHRAHIASLTLQNPYCSNATFPKNNPLIEERKTRLQRIEFIDSDNRKLIRFYKRWQYTENPKAWKAFVVWSMLKTPPAHYNSTCTPVLLHRPCAKWLVWI